MGSITSSLEKTVKRYFWNWVSHRMGAAGPLKLRLGNSPSILALRPDRLGDFILSTPALLALQKQAGSGLKLNLVAGERNAEIARFFFPKATVLVSGNSFLKKLLLWARLWRGRYDASLDLHSYPFSTTSALSTLLSGSPLRVGFEAKGEFKELSKRVFNLGVPSPPEDIHESEKSFLLVKKLFPSVKKTSRSSFKFPSVPASITAQVDFFCKEAGMRRKTRVLGVHPTLQKEDNRWSRENYVELIRQLGAVPNLIVLVVHGRGEEDELREFLRTAGKIPNLFVLPQDDVLFILEAAKRFDLFVCGDSGLTHLAALVTRIFAVFGPSDPKRWGPLEVGNQHKLFRKKNKKCDSVKPTEVAREIKKLFRYKTG
jgi:ADP-heptose:LPS heptosyltransferase